MSKSTEKYLICVYILVGIVGVLLLPACQREAERSVVEVAVDALPGSAEPRLSRGENGPLVLSWLEAEDNVSSLRYSLWDNAAWSPPVTVASGQSWFVNWADFPSVVPIDGALWAAHWLRKRAGGKYAYDVMVSLSPDAGRNWSEAMSPHTDGTATEHGFATLFPLQGKVGALWLDGRNTATDGHHGSGGAMSLRSTAIDAAAKIDSDVLVDERVCDCCQTDVAIASGGPVAVYRNRSEHEIRDIFVSRWRDDGWTPGIAVSDDGWQVAGCPVNGPAIAASGDTVVVAWFTAAGGEPAVRFARSDDGGVTFGRALQIAGQSTLGRVDVALLPDGAALVSYFDSVVDEGAEIRLRKISADGRLMPSFLVAKTDAGRMSGFPQLANIGKRIVMAWTDTTSERPVVRSAFIDLD